jgi:hypothetical protein
MTMSDVSQNYDEPGKPTAPVNNDGDYMSNRFCLLSADNEDSAKNTDIDDETGSRYD